MPESEYLNEDLPRFWRNSRAATEGVERRDRWEYGLYTDAHVTGEVREGLGPYALLNGLYFGSDAEHPSLILRVDDHVPPIVWNEVWAPNALHIEAAALLALALRIRCRSGGELRRFTKDDDQAGQPFGFPHRRPVLSLPRTTGPQPERPILPALIGRDADLTHAVDQLNIVVGLTPRQAVALIHAARAYEEALWVAESDPALSWLKLVNAVESAAGAWKSQKVDPVRSFVADKPDVAATIRAKGGDDVLEVVAHLFADLGGSTDRFLAFLAAFCTEPPDQRPGEDVQLDWSELEAALRQVYKCRSRNLHRAEPFPPPMLTSPLQRISDEAPMEVWPSPDGTFMLLQTFEYLVGEALRAWWRSLTNVPE